jgi:lipopolysaccharide/colanic/teichoic acid biosynthesis glycosyltransferase
MPPSRSFFIVGAERVIALIMLACIAWPLFLVAVFIHVTAGGPVILTDEFTTSRGSIVHRHRFRTTGQGTPVFRAFGRFLRAYSIDEFPAFWDVLRGEIGLGDVLRRP